MTYNYGENNYITTENNDYMTMDYKNDIASKNKGYMTVEAALVMPMVFGLILFAMFLMFFRYDRCLMEQNLERALIEIGTLSWEEKQQLVDQLKIDAETYGSDQYLFWAAKPVVVKAESEKIHIDGGGGIYLPFGQLIGTSMAGSADCEYVADLLDEPLVLRMAGKVMDLTGK